MNINFFKYHGTGNDFIMMDARSAEFPFHLFDEKVKRNLCHRHFGIGADGVIFLKNDSEADFYMDYYNSDGRPSSMCGNGGRCTVRLASDLKIIKDQTRFRAVDGMHVARIEKENVALQMIAGPVQQIGATQYFVNTGSPHYLSYLDSIEDLDIVKEGRAIRYSPDYAEEGVNVNFITELDNHQITIATYERGVEDETLSCGTGVTASALTQLKRIGKGEGEIQVSTKGGQLSVRVERNVEGKSDVWLVGPTALIYQGTFNTNHFQF